MTNKNLHNEIALIACEIYVQGNYDHGHDLDQWLFCRRFFWWGAVDRN